MKPEIALDKNIQAYLTTEKKALLLNFLDTLLLDSEIDGKKLELCLVESSVIPVSVFTRDLGILEACAKFLHENRGLTLKEASIILKRSQSNVSVSYKNSVRKHPERFSDLSYTLGIPYNSFRSDLTCFESVCLFLKDRMELNYHKIGLLLKRDERTIWTIYKRSRAKGGGKRR